MVAVVVGRCINIGVVQGVVGISGLGSEIQGIGPRSSRV